MRISTTKRLVGRVVLFASLAAPAHLSAFFWSGPGCLVANMFGMGNFTGGLDFSMGGGGYGAGSGHGYGRPYGYPPPGAFPHPSAYPLPLMSPAKPPAGSARSARDILQANIWSERGADLQPLEAGDRDTAPPNRWQYGR